MLAPALARPHATLPKHDGSGDPAPFPANSSVQLASGTELVHSYGKPLAVHHNQAE